MMILQSISFKSIIYITYVYYFFKTVLDIDRYTMNFTGYIGVSKLNTMKSFVFV